MGSRQPSQIVANRTNGIGDINDKIMSVENQPLPLEWTQASEIENIQMLCLNNLLTYTNKQTSKQIEKKTILRGRWLLKFSNKINNI